MTQISIGIPQQVRSYEGMSVIRREFAHTDCNLQEVLLYVPNIVGYVRLALLALAIATGNQKHYYTAFYLVVLNFALDAVDGILARALHQVRWSPHLSRASEAETLGAIKHRDHTCSSAVMALMAAHLVSQESGFGAWLDVVVDNISRGAIWCWAVEGPLAVFPIALEFLTFASTQKVSSEPYVVLQHPLAKRWATCFSVFGSELEVHSPLL